MYYFELFLWFLTIHELGKVREVSEDSFVLKLNNVPKTYSVPNTDFM